MMRIGLSSGMLAMALAVGVALPAAGQGISDYRDDRSTPEAIVESLYNAIARNEFARAWGYFIDPPAATYDAYVDGFADTASVEIEIGAVAGDCGAGTCHYEVPVILHAIDNGGALTSFSGCYVVREVNAGAQTPPFRPLGIVSGTFAVADANNPAFPEDCGGGPSGSAGAQAINPVVWEMFEGQRDRCRAPGAYEDEPQIFELHFRYEWDEPGTTTRTMTLYQFWCTGGAYNIYDLFYLEDEYGEVSPVQFAYPNVAVTYADEAQEVLDTVAIRDFGATDLLGIATFDPETQSIHSFVKWRGLGDAAESGVWVFENGAFRLDYFEVDPTFDGEINRIVVLENGLPVEPRPVVFTEGK